MIAVVDATFLRLDGERLVNLGKHRIPRHLTESDPGKAHAKLRQGRVVYLRVTEEGFMSEPITLYKGDKTKVTHAPSMARQLEADGWSQTPPVTVHVDSDDDAPQVTIWLRKAEAPDTEVATEAEALALEADGWERFEPQPGGGGEYSAPAEKVKGKAK